jgi:hypothetical protein
MYANRKDLFDLVQSWGFEIKIQPPIRNGNMVIHKAVITPPGKAPFLVQEWTNTDKVSKADFYDTVLKELSKYI